MSLNTSAARIKPPISMWMLSTAGKRLPLQQMILTKKQYGKER